MNHKVSDMNKEYIINFLQEYSHYVKRLRTIKLFKDIKCPTEFFNTIYLDILEETDTFEAAFSREPYNTIDKV